jgi:tRNA(His) guanylyltransferase
MKRVLTRAFHKEVGKEEWQVLAKRMKDYEARFSSQLEYNQPLIIRLDGCGFSKFTKNFQKPFDYRLHRALTLATADLMDQFHPKTGYVASDEVSLIFNESVEEARSNPMSLLYNGRIQKITSVTASALAAKFTRHLYKLLIMEGDQKGALDLLNNLPHFDARVIQFPNRQEATENIRWRQMDSLRNSTVSLARHHYSQEQIENRKSKELTQLLRDKGVHWSNSPPQFRLGTFIKRQKSVKQAIDPRTNEQRQAFRQRWEPKSLALDFDLFADYWPQDASTEQDEQFYKQRKEKLH